MMLPIVMATVIQIARIDQSFIGTASENESKKRNNSFEPIFLDLIPSSSNLIGNTNILVK